MKTLYLDCNAGISGNMFLGALLDLGFPREQLNKELAKLPIHLPVLQIERIVKNGISAVYFEVEHFHEHQHRGLHDIVDLITKATLSQRVKDRAISCFQKLAAAEAKIHGVSADEVHFHEVGALDAIIDIVGVCLGLDYFRIEQILVSPVRLGFGTVQCAHGMIPIPAPATMELLQGYQVYGGELEGEWATPTGAALLREFAQTSGSLPELQIQKIGYGAGTANRSIPNVLRIVLGSSDTGSSKETQVVIETNIDNMNPEFFGFLGEQLFQTGVRDYYLTPVYMKKGRPGTLITVVVDPEKQIEVENLLFTQTTTLGVRKYLVRRSCLERKIEQVKMGSEVIHIKAGLMNGRVLKLAPEYEDCVRIAREYNRPLKDVYEEALQIGRKELAVKLS
jgi:uncharacterized protein (TIGR00299 family) protein